jgi:hypothetical protein
MARCTITSSRVPDATGSFSGFVTVARTFRPIGGSQTVDCATVPEGCAVSVFDGFSRVIGAPSPSGILRSPGR